MYVHFEHQKDETLLFIANVVPLFHLTRNQHPNILELYLGLFHDTLYEFSFACHVKWMMCWLHVFCLTL
jgi:hypothetical protein